MGQAPNSFTFTPTTLSAIFNGQAQINGMPLTSNDWIAAFDSSGNCCGANQLIINNGISYINLVIYGDDPTSSNIDEGMNSGEDFTIKLYQSSSGLYYSYPNDSSISSFSGWLNTNGTPMGLYDNINDIYNFMYNQNISFNLNTSLCENASPIILSGGFPLGGNYSGNGVVNGSFDPTISGPGLHQLSYVLNSDTAFSLIEVFSTVDITLLTNGPFCDNESNINLISESLGGVYSGSGVLNNMFNPNIIGPGSYWINYSLTDSNSCTYNNQTLVSVYNALMKPIINQMGNELYCSISNVNYQWLDANFDSIPLANSQSFLPLFNDNYYVRISNANCSETSDLYSFVLTNTNENYIDDFVFDYLSSSFKTTNKIDKILIYDINGKLVQINNSNNLATENINKGLYFINVYYDEKIFSLKLIL